MRIIIILAAIVLAHSASLHQVQAGPGENQGVIDCIATNYKDIVSVATTCGPYLSDNVECYKDYRAVELCLVNNNCQYPRDAASISTECWNCWKDLPLASSKFTDFQDKIAKCSELFLSLALFALAFLLA